MYARYKVRSGTKNLSSNKEVAQGSVINPALFKIFIEVSVTTSKKTRINLEHLLFYADDLLTLCETIEQVKRTITVVTDWSDKNGMTLNNKKSRIVIFKARNSKIVPLMCVQKEEIRSRKKDVCIVTIFCPWVS